MPSRNPKRRSSNSGRRRDPVSHRRAPIAAARTASQGLHVCATGATPAPSRAVPNAGLWRSSRGRRGPCRAATAATGPPPTHSDTEDTDMQICRSPAMAARLARARPPPTAAPHTWGGDGGPASLRPARATAGPRRHRRVWLDAAVACAIDPSAGAHADEAAIIEDAARYRRAWGRHRRNREHGGLRRPKTPLRCGRLQRAHRRGDRAEAHRPRRSRRARSHDLNRARARRENKPCNANTGTTRAAG